MTQSMVSVVFFLLVLVSLPFAIQWIRQRMPGNVEIAKGNARFISAVGVGVSQRVVTVEVGPEGARVWLTLGVTPQSITCLHSGPAPQSSSLSS